ncbi:MAG: GTP cyclohydrolase, partial [Nonlabens ulvanivorans]
MIEIKRITAKADIKKFVKFQQELYQDNTYYVPPIVNDEMSNFDPEKNQVFKNADCWLFLAYKGKKI